MAINLAAVTDINRVVHQINEGEYDIAPSQFYDKMLLDTIKLGSEHYVHLAHTENYTLPKGTKKLQKRRWGGLTAHTTPLLEGIPPRPDKTSMESITFTATAFGRYMEFTDRVNLDQIDPQIAHYTKELGDVMVRTLERYARETLLSAASKLFANNRTAVGGLQIGDVITIADLRFAVLRMERLLVKPLASGYFNYICSPEQLYDLIDDPLVVKYMEINQTTKDLYNSGKPFPLFKVQFIPTMLDEFYTPELDNPGEYYDGTQYQLRMYAIDSAGVKYYRTVADDAVVSDDGQLTARKEITNTYLLDGTAIASKFNWTITGIAAYVATDTIEIQDVDGVATTVEVVASGATAGEINLADANALVWSQLPVHKGILYGKDALVKIGIAGEQNAKTYVQALGSAGVLDPLHQRQTIGAKINSIGYGLLRDEAVVVTYSVPTQAIYVSGLTAQEVQLGNTVTDKTDDVETAELDYRDYTVDPKDLTKGTVINK